MTRRRRGSDLPPRHRPFRPSRWALLLLMIVGIAVLADLLVPAGLAPPDERRVVLVQRGETLAGIARELKRQGLIRSTIGFNALARLMRLDRHIQAGQYSIKLGTTVPELLRIFARGMTGLNLVTIPEGLTLGEISLLLSNHLGVPIASFDSLAHARPFLDSLGIAAPSIEGYLAPDSYEFLPGTMPEVAFRTMVQRTQAILLRAAAGRDSLPLGLSLYQVLTLASIVEAEAMKSDERPRIARVYLNRLEKGMRLQADPTVGYALGRGPRVRLYLRDLTVGSPYNTYLHEGLPPGPICNPGRASIEGVLNATDGSNELFFVARGDGRHLFSNTYKEHLANIAAVRPPPKPDTTLVMARDTAAAKGASKPAAKSAAKPAKTTGKGGAAGTAPEPHTGKAAGTR
jgi:UPF0755 protein